MDTLAGLGGPDWFRLGDRDLALHVLRTHRLHAGETLSAITDDIRRRMGIGPRILPMSDDPVRTRVLTTASDTWLTNDFLDRLSNRRFFVNGLAWLTQDEQLIATTAQVSTDRSLPLTSWSARRRVVVRHPHHVRRPDRRPQPPSAHLSYCR